MQRCLAILTKKTLFIEFFRKWINGYSVYFSSTSEQLKNLVDKYSPEYIFSDSEVSYSYNFTVIRFSECSEVINFLHIREAAPEQKLLPAKSKYFSHILGNSVKIQKVREQILRVGNSDLPVLILGESGTGKTLVARAIHECSPRCKNVFFEESVTNLSESLVEADLFGTTKSAYTGAGEREGYFASSDKGTLFLDEIGDLSLKVQSKLLKVISDGEFRKVGSDKIIKTDVRLICATNVDLKTKIRQKEFREDLFWRISALIIEMPSLDERKTDIPIIAENFLTGNYGKKLSERSKEILMNTSWKGNIHQLENVLSSAATFCQTDIITPDFLRI